MTFAPSWDGILQLSSRTIASNLSQIILISYSNTYSITTEQVATNLTFVFCVLLYVEKIVCDRSYGEIVHTSGA